MNDIISKAKENFSKYIAKNDDIFKLEKHVIQVEKWAKKLLKENPDADSEIVMLGIYLHDISHYPVDRNADHAAKGEKEARNFLESENYPKAKTDAVCHLVRSHRCKDVQPQTIEAKILACADSASHFDDTTYLDIVLDGRGEYALGKLERDYRDIGIFPKVQAKLKPLYEAWKSLINAFDNIK